ncbi:hypothetical protein EX30DRAFT_374367 [Ascodesmis nigricans]|uniref:YAG7-like dimerisation domain-containing protein n=1 Tax=Ascodesmis nigricans TaxID=341454 RepID=A0A4S2MQS0_9PEZI|nr:hypothetical protein EX30DRAFT_374367 [Ascodesmis nigricans]
MSATPGATSVNPPKIIKKRSRGKKILPDASSSAQDKATSAASAPSAETTNAPAPEPKDEKKFMVELAKRLRKSTKKLESIEKDEEKIKDLSPEEISTTMILNKDQLKKIEQKPITQAVHTELVELNKLYNEQLAVLQEIEDERTKQFEEKLAAEVKKAREEGRQEGREEVTNEAKDKVTSLVKFLRLAGYRRSIPSEITEDNQAIESLLVLLYSGDEIAIEACNKLSGSSSDKVEETLTVTYERLKELAYELRLDDEGEPEPEQPLPEEETIPSAVAEGTLTSDVAEASEPKQLEELPEVRLNGMIEPEPTPATEGTESTLETPQPEIDVSAPEPTMPEAPVVQETTETTKTTEPAPEAPESSVPPPITNEGANQAVETAARAKDDEFVNVEHRRGRGRGPFRGGDRDGHFRGRGRGFRGGRGGERGRGPFRGADRDGHFRGRGGRGRGGDHQVHSPVAASS